MKVTFAKSDTNSIKSHGDVRALDQKIVGSSNGGVVITVNMLDTIQNLVAEILEMSTVSILVRISSFIHGASFHSAWVKQLTLIGARCSGSSEVWI